MDERSSDHKSQRDAKKEANPHIPFVHVRVAGEAVVVRILTNQRDQRAHDSMYGVWMTLTTPSDDVHPFGKGRRLKR